MRTGSNFLEANLNALPGVTSHGEVFNPLLHRQEGPDRAVRHHDGATATRDPRPPVAQAARRRPTACPAFAIFHDHDPRILDDVLDDPACAKIILTRNPVESYVSWKIAQATDQWKLTNAKRLKTGQGPLRRGRVSGSTCRTLQAFQLRLLNALQTTRPDRLLHRLRRPRLGRGAERAGRLSGGRGAAEGAGRHAEEAEPRAAGRQAGKPRGAGAGHRRRRRLQPGAHPELRTAPRRRGAVLRWPPPTRRFCSCPIRSGPEARDPRLVDRLGRGRPRVSNRRSLRQWKRKHPGHRSFTVLRHPLLRAHAAFRRKIVSGEAARPSPHPDQRLPGRAAAAGRALCQPSKPSAPPSWSSCNYCRLAVGGQTGAARRSQPGQPDRAGAGLCRLPAADLVCAKTVLPKASPSLRPRWVSRPPVPRPTRRSRAAVDLGRNPGSRRRRGLCPRLHGLRLQPLAQVSASDTMRRYSSSSSASCSPQHRAKVS